MITEEQKREPAKQPLVTAGHVCAVLSLLVCGLFWLQFLLYLAGRAVFANVTGFLWFRVMAVAVILAVLAAILRSKLWRLAVPAAALMFLFVSYVMGS